MARGCFVFRTADERKEWVWTEIQNGRLRQGWGPPGTELALDGHRRSRGEWVQAYLEGAREHWDHTGTTEDQAGRRYDILSRMLDIDAGDLLVVPKMPNWRAFAVLEAAGRYSSGTGAWNDFLHVVPVRLAATIMHDSREDVVEIQKMLRGYQAAVNNVWSERFRELVEGLVRQPPTSDEANLAEVVGRFSEPMLGELLQRLRRLKPHQLEKVLVSVFERQGYSILGTHSYDRQGGDADLIVSMPLPFLSAIDGFDQKIYIQIKQKTGVDHHDREGVEQLVRRSAGDHSPRLVLVSTADDFTPECKRDAEEHGVSLLAGMQLARAVLPFL